MGKYQPIQTAKDVRMTTFTIRKRCSRGKAEEMAQSQPFAPPRNGQRGQRLLSHKRLFEEMKYVSYVPSATSMEDKNRNGLCRANLWENPLSTGVDPQDSLGRATRFWGIEYQTLELGVKGTESMK